MIDWINKDSKDNALATATVAADAKKTHFVHAIRASFNDPAISGTLTIKQGATVLNELDVHGSRDIDFVQPMPFKMGVAVSATLSASGTAGKIGKVSVEGFSA